MYREDDIEEKIDNLGFHPIDILVVGPTGAGKSTTLNTFFEKEVAAVGEVVDPETKNISPYKLTENIRFWDTPGLGDSTYKDNIYLSNLQNKLNQYFENNGHNYKLIDLILVIINGSYRDLGTIYKIISHLSNLIQNERILFAVNHVDMEMLGRNWNYNTSTPNDKLIKYIIEYEKTVISRIYDSTGFKIKNIVSYSAKYSYNINSLYDMIINNIPDKLRT